MKKIFTLLTIFAIVCGASLQAATIAAGENQQWWGYMGSSTTGNSVGINGPDTYHCAIYIPGNHDVAGGKAICAVRFSLVAPNADNVKVWTASTLPTGTPTATNTLWIADVAKEYLGESIDVALDQPYAIPAGGVYVGYSFTITEASTDSNKYPVVTMGTDMPNGLLIRTDDAIPSWGDLYGYDFGVLALQVLLEGRFADNALSPTMPKNQYYVQLGQTIDTDVVLDNAGLLAVSNFSYTINDGEEQTVTFGKGALQSFDQGSVTITIPADDIAGSSTKKLTVTKVNGKANQSPSTSTTFTLNTLDRVIQRNVVVEEFTGTGCGYCPRGLVGMEKLRETFGDRFIGIGIHQYNQTDAMYIADYPYLNWGGAPSCRINRGDVIDPYYGSGDDVCNDFRAEMNELAVVEVDVFGTMDEAMTEVEAKACITPMFDATGYKLEMALVADGLKGTTSAWWQANYYAGTPASQQPQDLRIFCSGGKYNSGSVKNYVFNDVAVGTSYDRSGENQIEPLGTLAGGQMREVTYTLSLPTKATLRNALKKGTIYVVALVIGPDGRIANAAKREVGETDIDGIKQVLNNNGAAANYSVNGMLINTPQRGINIMRQTDGTVRKVMVK